VASGVDGVSGATFLTALNNTSNPVTLDQVNLLSLGLGNMNGSLGEVGSIAIIIGLVILLATKVIS
jgi:Na+-transporting NADH:ubiquinone oxidoreductase subunit NqrB